MASDTSRLVLTCAADSRVVVATTPTSEAALVGAFLARRQFAAANGPVPPPAPAQAAGCSPELLARAATAAAAAPLNAENRVDWPAGAGQARSASPRENESAVAAGAAAQEVPRRAGQSRKRPEPHDTFVVSPPPTHKPFAGPPRRELYCAVFPSQLATAAAAALDLTLPAGQLSPEEAGYRMIEAAAQLGHHNAAERTKGLEFLRVAICSNSVTQEIFVQTDQIFARMFMRNPAVEFSRSALALVATGVTAVAVVSKLTTSQVTPLLTAVASCAQDPCCRHALLAIVELCVQYFEKPLWRSDEDQQIPSTLTPALSLLLCADSSLCGYPVACRLASLAPWACDSHDDETWVAYWMRESCRVLATSHHVQAEDRPMMHALAAALLEGDAVKVLHLTPRLQLAAARSKAAFQNAADVALAAAETRHAREAAMADVALRAPGAHSIPVEAAPLNAGTSSLQLAAAADAAALEGDGASAALFEAATVEASPPSPAAPALAIAPDSAPMDGLLLSTSHPKFTESLEMEPDKAAELERLLNYYTKPYYPEALLPPPAGVEEDRQEWVDRMSSLKLCPPKITKYTQLDAAVKELRAAEWWRTLLLMLSTLKKVEERKLPNSLEPDPNYIGRPLTRKQRKKLAKAAALGAREVIVLDDDEADDCKIETLVLDEMSGSFLPAGGGEPIPLYDPAAVVARGGVKMET